jgi:hypothetical protein
MHPESGDVLVSSRPARVEHDISIVPRSAHLTCPTYDSALARARELAKRLAVDAWLTEDFTHFLQIASFRPRTATVVKEAG